jgi:hypothetical protein
VGAIFGSDRHAGRTAVHERVTDISRRRSVLGSRARCGTKSVWGIPGKARALAGNRRKVLKFFGIAPILLIACGVHGVEGAPASGTTPFVFDGNRVYAALDFVRPDGSVHRALAFVDMGSPDMTLRKSLFKELKLDQEQPLRFRVGEFSVQAPAAQVVSDPREPTSMGSDLEVEGTLPARILQRYQVVIDYGRRALTVARPGTVRPRGIPVPFHLDAETGLAAVEASIAGKPYAITIDSGSAYTWVRQRAAEAWLASHPGWERGRGAVGASNMMMSGDETETAGILLRIPVISSGALRLRDVGALAAGPGHLFPGNLDLFDWYSRKNALPVIGWIGGNVLQRYRLTIDYPNRMMYWLRQTAGGSDELNQVGITLRFERGEFFVAAIARKNDQPTVQGVRLGDRLVRIGDLDAAHATWGAIFRALHGKPGETRDLILDRRGTRVMVTAKVTEF